MQRSHKCEFLNSLLYFPKHNFEFFGHRFRLIFPYKYFYIMENKVRNSGQHFFDAIVFELNIRERNSYVNPCIDPSIKTIINKKMKEIRLDTNNFVLIAPESLSNVRVYNFFEKLTMGLKKLGYDVYCNTIDTRSIVPNSKTCYLSHMEFIILASMSKCIIGLRSGLMDILSHLKINMHVIYTNFFVRGELKELDSYSVLNGFTLKKLPNIDKHKINEYIYHENDDILISSILDY